MLQNVGLFSSFQFNANLIVPSLFAVMAIVDMKQFFEHPHSFFIYPSLTNWSIHSLTSGSWFIGILLPFTCIGLNGWLKYVFTMKLFFCLFFQNFGKSVRYIQFEFPLKWCVRKLTGLTVRLKFHLAYFYPDREFDRVSDRPCV